MTTIDINCDMGEGIGNEMLLMPFISAANIACGYHAGDEQLMREVVRYCLRAGVAIGAHPSYPDRENFGRTDMELSRDELTAAIRNQLTILNRIVKEEGGRLHHVKPHGALYNQAAHDPSLSQQLARIVFDFDSSLVYYGLAGSVMIREAEKTGLKVAPEAFADRRYLGDGTLTPRGLDKALINDAEDAVQQVLQLIQQQTVTTVDGATIPMCAATICIHGDGAHAAALAKQLYHSLQQAGIQLQKI